MSAEPHIVIIGGGFSGAAVAIELLRLAPNGVRVTLLEPRQTPGAGVAYSTAEPTHRINVPAARMQLTGDEEGAFDRWYRRQPAFAADAQALRPDGSVYPQRGQFGCYVAQRFPTPRPPAADGCATCAIGRSLFIRGRLAPRADCSLRPTCWCWRSAIHRLRCRRRPKPGVTIRR